MKIRGYYSVIIILALLILRSVIACSSEISLVVDNIEEDIGPVQEVGIDFIDLILYIITIILVGCIIYYLHFKYGKKLKSNKRKSKKKRGKKK